MRIVIDLQGAQGASRGRGIGRYTVSFVREFLKLTREHDVFLLFNGMLADSIEPIRQELRGLYRVENQLVWSAVSPVSAQDQTNASRRQLAEIIWEASVESLAPDLLIIPSLFDGFGDDVVAHVPAKRSYTVASIVLDLIPLIYNDVYLRDPAQRRFYETQLARLKESDLLLAISDATAHDAALFLKIEKSRIITIGAGIDEDFASRSIAQENEHSSVGLSKPFVLYVSGGDARKNHKRLIEAFAELPKDLRDKHQLALVGNMPEAVAEQLRQIGQSSGLSEADLVIETDVSEGRLARFYEQCHAFAFPSWYEGFGLPILEAMAFGKPVIGAASSSIPQIVRNPEALFDPYDVQSIKLALERVLRDQAFREQLILDASATVKEFSWESVAKKALGALEVVQSRRPIRSGEVAAVNALTSIRSSDLLHHIPPENITCHLSESIRPSCRRQLLLDISELVHRDAKTGIQRVVRSILGSLLANPPQGWLIEPVYSHPSEQGYRYAREFTDRFLGMPSPWHEDTEVSVWAGDVFCALDLNHEVLISKQDLLADWRVRGVSVMTVVYDLLPLRLPKFFSPGMKALHGRWIESLSRHDGALCISEAVASDLQAWLLEHQIFTSPAFRIEWFHLGADLSGSAPTKGLPDNADSQLELLARKPTALMVGTVEPRKGHDQTLSAFELLWKEGIDINLMIVGKEGWDIEKLSKRLRQHPEAGKRLFWLPGISDEYLDKIYEASDVLIAASEGEGFGLPLIEAAQKGLSLIARDIPVFREVAGEHAYYFPNTSNAVEFAKCIQAWMRLYATNNHPKSTNLPWLTWDQCAIQFFRKLTNDWAYQENTLNEGPSSFLRSEDDLNYEK